MRPTYEAGLYEGEGRRWAVFCWPSCTWTFARRYGRRAAEAYARRLTREATVRP